MGQVNVGMLRVEDCRPDECGSNEKGYGFLQEATMRSAKSTYQSRFEASRVHLSQYKQ